jgi:hypothetical protein
VEVIVSGAAIWPSATAKGLGGGDKIRWKLTVRTRADVELVVRHLGAAKG